MGSRTSPKSYDFHFVLGLDGTSGIMLSRRCRCSPGESPTGQRAADALGSTNKEPRDLLAVDTVDAKLRHSVSCAGGDDEVELAVSS